MLNLLCQIFRETTVIKTDEDGQDVFTCMTIECVEFAAQVGCTGLAADIAGIAEENAGLLTPDDGCHYDQLIEINLDEVRTICGLAVFAR